MIKEINIDTSQLDRLTKELKGFETQVAEAAYHALNRTVDHTYTQIGRIVPQYYAISSKDVKSTLKKIKPTSKKLEAGVVSVGRRLTFVHFQLTPRKPPANRRRYKVKVKIKKDSGIKTVTTSPLPFIAPTGAKSPDKVQYNIFKRKGEKRLPIEVLHTLSVPQMMGNKEVEEKIRKVAQEKFEERLEHEITRIMTNTQKNIKKG